MISQQSHLLASSIFPATFKSFDSPPTARTFVNVTINCRLQFIIVGKSLIIEPRQCFCCHSKKMRIHAPTFCDYTTYSTLWNVAREEVSRVLVVEVHPISFCAFSPAFLWYFSHLVGYCGARLVSTSFKCFLSIYQSSLGSMAVVFVAHRSL